jgi:GntR family transcriptional repressor for pyruvate dehydrogenase complex
MDGSGRALLAQHIEIADAIIAGDPDRAETAARVHMDFVEDSYRKGREQARREALAEKRRKLSA